MLRTPLPVSWKSRPGPLVLAHRGDSANYPENTLAAFRSAERAGADGLELDVRLCRSGEVVVFHDEDLERMFGCSDLVRETSLGILRKLSAGDGEETRVSTLEEVLRAIPTLLVNVELKTAGIRDLRLLVSRTLECIERCQARDRVLVSSFDPRLLGLSAASLRGIPLGALCSAEHSRWLQYPVLARLLGCTAVHPHHEIVDAESMKRWRAAGLRVHTWTVDDPQELLRVKQLGVDAIICNDPAAAIDRLFDAER